MANPQFLNYTAQGWRAEYNTAGESALMCMQYPIPFAVNGLLCTTLPSVGCLKQLPIGKYCLHNSIGWPNSNICRKLWNTQHSLCYNSVMKQNRHLRLLLKNPCWRVRMRAQNRSPKSLRTFNGGCETISNVAVKLPTANSSRGVENFLGIPFVGCLVAQGRRKQKKKSSNAHIRKQMRVLSEQFVLLLSSSNEAKRV